MDQRRRAILGSVLLLLPGCSGHSGTNPTSAPIAAAPDAKVPEITAESGCRLVEVWTTNRKRRADYEAGLHAETALVLKVHASN